MRPAGLHAGGEDAKIQAVCVCDCLVLGIFFFQAEDGIRYLTVTGVQTCALPISVVHGSCTAGGAYVPAMSDENVIVRNQGRVFLGGPPLVKAATGEDIDAESLGGAEVHCRESGVCDHYAQNDTHALAIARRIITRLKGATAGAPPRSAAEPRYDPAELYGVIPASLRKPYDVREEIARLTHASTLDEFKEPYGPTLVCAFAHLCGYPVGILAN